MAQLAKAMKEALDNIKKRERQTMKTKVINSKDLTGECWMIQFMGLEACQDCEFKDTPECGGQKIREDLLTKGQHGKVTVTGLPDQR